MHTSVRPAAFAILASLVACGEPDPSQPAPIGMSGGSVTAGSGQGSATMTTAGTDGPPGMTTLPGSDSSDGSTGSTGGSTGGPDSMPDSSPDSMPDSSPDSSPTSETTAGAGTCIEGDVCEGDGVCVLFVDGAGIELVCSHGGSGEPCALDAHCLSGQCVSEVSMGGVVSTCA